MRAKLHCFYLQNHSEYVHCHFCHGIFLIKSCSPTRNNFHWIMGLIWMSKNFQPSIRSASHVHVLIPTKMETSVCTLPLSLMVQTHLSPTLHCSFVLLDETWSDGLFLDAPIILTLVIQPIRSCKISPIPGMVWPVLMVYSNSVLAMFQLWISAGSFIRPPKFLVPSVKLISMSISQGASFWMWTRRYFHWCLLRWK